MKFIHTSDWHLGHKLHEYHRVQEHQSFLTWLLDTIKENDIDALLIAGDIFDSPHAPVEALQLLYRFLHTLHTENPHVQVVMIAGNHDSPQRLEAPQVLLEYVNVKVVGTVPRTVNRVLDVDKLYIPLYGKDEDICGYVVAVPYLRPSDLPVISPKPESPLIEGVRQVYQETLTKIKDRCDENLPVIVMGHCYMLKGQVSADSEKKILGGNLHALPNSIFDHDVSYVALGHLHLAQQLDDEGKIRYSGSPIPLSMAEKDYQHQVILVETEGNKIKELKELVIPRFVEMIQIPENINEPIGSTEALRQLKALALMDPHVPEWKRPYLKVEIQLDSPEPNLRNQIAEVMKDKLPRLINLKIKLNHGQASKGMLEMLKKTSAGFSQFDNLHQTLQSISGEQAFRLSWQKYFNKAEIPEEVLGYFHEIYNKVFEENVEDDEPIGIAASDLDFDRDSSDDKEEKEQTTSSKSKKERKSK
jgi:exonuclease SbcD